MNGRDWATAMNARKKSTVTITRWLTIFKPDQVSDEHRKNNSLFLDLLDKFEISKS
jgi:hypothetical protein